MNITINTERPALDVTISGETHRWHYDVVLLKLEIERLTQESGNKQPQKAELTQFAEFLVSQGMPACNLDVALRVWSLVIVQFAKLAKDIGSQVAEIAKDD